MERLEKKLVLIALALMAIFTALVVYASMGLNIVLPTCENHIAPYKEAKVISKSNNAFEVHYVARMWSFEPADLILPEKADVDLYVSSADVTHGFEVAGTNLNLMVVPGTVNSAHHRFETKGEYLVVCHEYCGLNHQNMFSRIRVVAPEEYSRLMEELSRRVKAEGEQLSIKYECTSCHTSDGTEGLAPTFKGMFGRKEKLADGKEVTVDEAYLFESIKSPDQQIVMNFEPGTMPSVEISDEEIQKLIDYIKTLK